MSAPCTPTAAHRGRSAYRTPRVSRRLRPPQPKSARISPAARMPELAAPSMKPLAGIIDYPEQGVDYCARIDAIILIVGLFGLRRSHFSEREQETR